MYFRQIDFIKFKLRAGILILALFALVFTSCKTPSIIATQAIQQGDLANNQHNYELAIQHYNKYLETAPALGVMRNPLMEGQHVAIAVADPILPQQPVAVALVQRQIQRKRQHLLRLKQRQLGKGHRGRPRSG